MPCWQSVVGVICICMFKLPVPVKYQLSNYICVLHVKIQQYAFSSASDSVFVLSFCYSLLFFLFQIYHIVPAWTGLHFFRLSQKCARCLLKSADHESNSLIPIVLCFALLLVVTDSMLAPTFTVYTYTEITIYF